MARELVVAGVGRVDEDALDAAAQPMAMDEDAFRAFYDLTSRTLWGYLFHLTGDPHAADDLLQETYLRFLGSTRRWESDEHQRHFLFRVATNLARDHHRRARVRRAVPLDEGRAGNAHAPGTAGIRSEVEVGADRVDAEGRLDLRRAFERLSIRERELLWLAYAEGSSHAEIATTLGLRAGGIRVLLFRARRKLAGLLRGSGMVKR